MLVFSQVQEGEPELIRPLILRPATTAQKEAEGLREEQGRPLLLSP